MIEKLIALVIITIIPNGTLFIQENGNFGQTYECGKDLGGYYEIGTNKISLCSEEIYLTRQQVLNHELGHYVYYQKLNNKQRKTWEKIYGDDYSEGFADLFSDRLALGFNISFPGDKNTKQKEKFMEKVFEKFIN